MLQKAKLGVLALVMVTIAACQPGSNTTTTVTNENLKSLDNEGFVMYYPNYFDEYDNSLQDYSYQSRNKNNLGGANNIGLVVTENTEDSSKPSQKDCEDISAELASALGGETKETTVVDENNMQGCYNRIEAELGGLKFVSENRVLFKPNTENATIYSVNITYATDAEANEVQDLQDSLKAFMIK